MRILNEFPRDVRQIPNLWIPLADGGRMAARIFLPMDADDRPVPAIVEYNPYRKRDLTAINNGPFHAYLAGHGFAGVRLEIRGSGESDGILRDEYLAQELADGVEAIAWLADQPWCSGKVGIIGNSWSGFNALQIAALRPPALGAIVTSCSTDDRYADDMHYMGGCLLTDTLDWGTMFQALLVLPPDPALVGDDWRAMWRARMDDVSVPLAAWLTHQRRDKFWQHGSVGEDFAAIEVPVLAVGGWLDGYSNAIPRLLAGLSGPRQAVIGPWAHAYPHLAVPGPGYDFLPRSCAGSTIGSRAPTTGRWTRRSCGRGWPRRPPRGRSTPPLPVDGSPRRRGHRRGSRPVAGGSATAGSTRNRSPAARDRGPPRG